MKVVPFRCPNCGARAQPPSDGVLRCEYCGVASRIQRTTVMPPARVPPVPHELAAARPAPRASQSTGVMLAVAGGCVAAAVAGMIAFTTLRTDRELARLTADEPATQAGPRKRGWQTTAPLVADLTGDAVQDIVGRNREVQHGDLVRLTLVDGATGEVRWETAPIGSYTDTYQGMLTLAGDLVLFASPRGTVNAFTAATGEPRWTAALDERTDHFCDGGDAVIAVGADGVERPLRRSDGALAAPANRAPEPAVPVATKGRKRAAPAKPEPCSALPSDRAFGASWMFSNDPDYARAERAGVDGRTPYVGPTGRVIAGTRKTGTRIGVLVALDDAGELRWTTPVAVEPLAAEADAPQDVVVGADDVCATYYVSSQQRVLHLTCFAGSDGKRRWDLAMPRGASYLRIAGKDLLVVSGDGPQLLDIKTGAVRWAY